MIKAAAKTRKTIPESVPHANTADSDVSQQACAVHRKSVANNRHLKSRILYRGERIESRDQDESSRMRVC